MRLADKIATMAKSEESPIWVMPTSVIVPNVFPEDSYRFRPGVVYRDGTNNGHFHGNVVGSFSLGEDYISFKINTGNMWYGPVVFQRLNQFTRYRFSLSQSSNSIRIGIAGYKRSGDSWIFDRIISNSSSTIQTFSTGEDELIAFVLLGSLDGGVITFNNFQLVNIDASSDALSREGGGY